MSGNDVWYVYIVECKGGELYTGIAKDVKKRLALHNSGQACRYTKYRKPVKLRHKECAGSYNVARRREKELKGYTRNKKIELIDCMLCKSN